MPEDVKPETQEVPVTPEPPKEDSDALNEVKEPTSEDSKELERTSKNKTTRIQRIKDWVASNKKISIPGGLLLLIVLLLAIPFTRYSSLGLIYKKNFTISVYDTTAGTPVSGASVSSGLKTATTDGTGKAVLKLPVGPHKFTLTKKYYQDRSFVSTVPILSQKSTPQIKLTATGRQVKISIKNVVTKKALANVAIKVDDITASTDKDGNATIVLPASLASEKAALSLSGFNQKSVDIKISNTEIAQNDFTLTPSGKVYFLSNRTGGINVMKSDYDGSNAVAAVSGTGTESLSGSQLSQSPDGKYIAYVTKRSASDSTPQLYVAAASDDKLLSVDTGNANFVIKGWSGNYLIYTVNRNDISTWLPGVYKLKSYAADSGKLTLLDQSSATGDQNSSAYEYYPFVRVMKNLVVYTKDWTGYMSQNSSLVEGKTFTLRTIEPSGASPKSLTTYPALDSVQTNQNAPDGMVIWQQEYASAANHYFSYKLGSTVNAIEALSSDKFYDGTFGYYLSSDNSRSLWSTPRDGKSTIVVSDSLSAGSVNVAETSDYTPYGWAGSDYILLTKNNSELYIMSAGGGEALKITNFQPTYIFDY